LHSLHYSSINNLTCNGLLLNACNNLNGLKILFYNTTIYASLYLFLWSILSCTEELLHNTLLSYTPSLLYHILGLNTFTSIASNDLYLYNTVNHLSNTITNSFLYILSLLNTYYSINFNHVINTHYLYTIAYHKINSTLNSFSCSTSLLQSHISDHFYSNTYHILSYTLTSIYTQCISLIHSNTHSHSNHFLYTISPYLSNCTSHYLFNLISIIQTPTYIIAITSINTHYLYTIAYYTPTLILALTNSLLIRIEYTRHYHSLIHTSLYSINLILHSLLLICIISIAVINYSFLSFILHINLTISYHQLLLSIIVLILLSSYLLLYLNIYWLIYPTITYSAFNHISIQLLLISIYLINLHSLLHVLVILSYLTHLHAFTPYTFIYHVLLILYAISHSILLSLYSSILYESAHSLSIYLYQYLAYIHTI
jgi:hypothetical protein